MSGARSSVIGPLDWSRVGVIGAGGTDVSVPAGRPEIAPSPGPAGGGGTGFVCGNEYLESLTVGAKGGSIPLLTPSLGQIRGVEGRAAMDRPRREAGPLGGLGRGAGGGGPVVDRPAVPTLPARRTAVSGVGRPDESRLTSSPPRVSPRTVSMLDVRGLRGFDGINLGVYGPDGSGDQLIGAVRPGFTGRTSVDEMMDTYLPGFWNTRELSWSAAAENIRHVDATLRTPGLFWDEGWGSVHRATLWALCLMHRYADLVLDPTGVSGFSGDVLRRDLEAGSLRIRLKATPFLGWWADTAWMLLHVDAEQRFQLERISQRNINRVGASTSGGVIHVYPSTLIYGPVADYFFWHATKLHAWHAESGEPWAAVAGELCARAGLSEVAALAAVLIHEYTHDYRNRTYECAGGGHKAGCVTFLHQFTFYTRVLATHVLPLNRDLGMRNFVGPTPSLARYDVFGAGEDEQSSDSAFDGGGRCSNDGETAVVTTARTRFWQSHTPVRVRWVVPARCAESTAVSSGDRTVTTPHLRPL